MRKSLVHCENFLKPLAIFAKLNYCWKLSILLRSQHELSWVADLPMIVWLRRLRQLRLSSAVIQAPFCSSTNIVCNQLDVEANSSSWKLRTAFVVRQNFWPSFRFRNVLLAAFLLAETAGLVRQLRRICSHVRSPQAENGKLWTYLIIFLGNQIVFHCFGHSNHWAVRLTGAVEWVVSREQPTGYVRHEAKTRDKNK